MTEARRVGTSTRPTGRPSVITSHPLVSYFLIAFVFSWLLYLPGLLTYWGVLGLSPGLVGYLAVAGLLGPVFSGFVMAALTEGGAWQTCCAGSCFGGSG